MKLRLTPKQQLWSDVFRCAVQRSNNYFDEGDLERHAREHITVVLALQLGDQFWEEVL